MADFPNPSPNLRSGRCGVSSRSTNGPSIPADSEMIEHKGEGHRPRSAGVLAPRSRTRPVMDGVLGCGYVNHDSEYTHSGISTRHIAHQSSVGEMTPKTLYPGSGGGKPRGREPMLLQSEASSCWWTVGWGMVPRSATRRRLEVGVGRLANYSHPRKETRIYEVSYAL